MEAPRAHIRSVVVFYGVEENFSVEAFQLHVVNVVSVQIVSGGQW